MLTVIGPYHYWHYTTDGDFRIFAPGETKKSTISGASDDKSCERRTNTMNICKSRRRSAEQSDGYRVLVDCLWPRGIKTDLASMNGIAITLSTELRKAFTAKPSICNLREQYLQNWRNEQEGCAGRHRWQNSDFASTQQKNTTQN